MALINDIGSNGMSITTPAQQNTIINVAMTTTPGSNLTLSPIGGVSPYTFAVDDDDSLPAGISLAASTGVISGTPTAAQAATAVRIVITDSFGGSIRVAVTFHVAAVLAIANGLDSAATVGMTDTAAFSYQLYSTGGREPVTWAEQSGTRNTGISDVTSAGIVAGTPTDDTETASMVYRATDANGSTVDTATVSHPVAAALSVSAASITWTEGATESDSIICTGGTEPIYFATDINWPDGLSSFQEGQRTLVIHGVVGSGVSNDNITVTATDSGGGDSTGDTDTGLLTITISI